MSEAFHLKYRPKTFEAVIGHEATITRLKGLVKSGKVPNAIMILGPSSAGKTTLARCIASELNGTDMTNHPDYLEIDTGSQRTIDDIRSIIKTSKFRPQTKYKVICLDEFQAILSNSVAAVAMLKHLEEPSSKTIWILCSMDPTKFSTGNGKAIANRCNQIVLSQHSSKELFKQACRIAKGEKMTYLLDDEKVALKTVVKNSNGEMRTVANLIQGIQQYYDGLDTKPKVIGSEFISEVLKTTESSDEKLAVTMLTAVYACQFSTVQRAILDMQDGFMMVNMLVRLNTYLLNDTVLKGARHHKVWPSVNSKALIANLKSIPVTLGMIAAVNALLVETKSQAMTFAMDADLLISAKLYKAITEVKALRPKE